MSSRGPVIEGLEESVRFDLVKSLIEIYSFPSRNLYFMLYILFCETEGKGQ